jgi:O-antigen ligase
LFTLPVLVGAFLALRGQHMVVLRGYVVAATILAVVWPVLNPTGVLGTQFDKNPVGGFIASAILLLLAVRGLRRLAWCAPVLLVGLGLSASRGAILGLAVGVVVIGVLGSGGSRRAVFGGAVALAITAFVVFQFLPASTTARLTNYSASGNSSASYAIYYRDQYYKDALAVISAHAWTGVGVGNYHAGSVADLTYTADPHDVLLLEAAEGGYIFAASFLLLVLGSAFAMWRIRRSELAPAAAAVLLATAVHGMVDVYWVRGTPVPGFLLVGMACALAPRLRGVVRA